jgi:hypothetical protein
MTTLDTGGVRAQLDDAPVSRFHLKAAVTAGMGFFTDSYDHGGPWLSPAMSTGPQRISASSPAARCRRPLPTARLHR